MKHYRILEKKNQKEYTIQYLTTFFGVQIWKKLNSTIHYKYDDALTEIKKVITPEDYEDSEYGYHYIDAYKLFKTKEVKESTIASKTPELPKSPKVPKASKSEIETETEEKVKHTRKKKTNTTVFVPKSNQ